MKNLDSLRSKWTTDLKDPVGRTIYEAVPNNDRPRWATANLYLVMGDYTYPELKRLFEIAEDPNKWGQAHDAFQGVRALTLSNWKDTAPTDAKKQLVLDVAETAAKVIYNASGMPAPFDHHAGWIMAARMKKIVEQAPSAEFEDKCWKALIFSIAA